MSLPEPRIWSPSDPNAPAMTRHREPAREVWDRETTRTLARGPRTMTTPRHRAAGLAL